MRQPTLMLCRSLLKSFLGLLCGSSLLLGSSPSVAQRPDNIDAQLQQPTQPGVFPTIDAIAAERFVRLAQEAQARGQLVQAIEYWQQAVAEYRRLNDLHSLGLVYEQLGLAYLAIEDELAAEAALRRSLGIARDLQDYPRQIQGFNLIGTLLLKRSRPAAAATAFADAALIARTTGDEPGEGLSLSHWGRAIARQGDYNRAIEFYRQAMRLLSRHPEAPGQPETLNNLGDAYQALQQPRQAAAEYGLAQRLAAEAGDATEQFRAYRGLALAYGVTQRWPAAIAQLEAWIELAQLEQNLRQELLGLHIYAQYTTFLSQRERSFELYNRAIAVATELEDARSVEILRNEQSQLIYNFPFGFER